MEIGLVVHILYILSLSILSLCIFIFALILLSLVYGIVRDVIKFIFKKGE